MRMLFVNPTLGGDFSALDISICNLATYLNERTSHKAAICDLTFHRKHWEDYLSKSIARFKPDIIGMSSNTLYMGYIKKIMRFIKQEHGLPIILGGYHASIFPEQTFSLPDVNAICIGDGEYALARYLSALEKNKSPKGIDGIWAKHKGAQVRNPRGSFIKEIDSLPRPDMSLWKDLDKYFYFLGMNYFIGTRGCPYQCTNCDARPISQHVNGPYYRVRDPVKYVEEIEYVWKRYGKSRGMRMAQLFDQVFTIDYNWLKRFCEAYIEKGLAKELPFSTFARFDNLDDEKMKLLSKANCKILRVGVEAGSTFIRNKVHKKNVSDRKINEVLDLGEKYDIGFTIFFMLGGPGETKKTINQSIEMARKFQKPNRRIAFFIYKPFTRESVELIKKYGGSIDEKRWAKADNITFDAVVRLKGVSPQQVEWYQKKAYFLTFGKRLLHMLSEQKLTYFVQFTTYIVKGLNNGLDISYLIPYFHIYGYDNVLK